MRGKRIVPHYDIYSKTWRAKDLIDGEEQLRRSAEPIDTKKVEDSRFKIRNTVPREEGGRKAERLVRQFA